MSDEIFPLDFGTNTDAWITSPSGRNLNLICSKNTTLFTDEKVKDVPIPDKYVLLKVTTATSGYTLQKVYGHPNNNSDWNSATAPQPAVVVPTYHAKVVLFDSSKGEAGSQTYDINVTRDAWYYLGKDASRSTWCRNIAFEPEDPSKTSYLTEQIHFPSRANKNLHGFFLLESESQRGNSPRQLHAESVESQNPYGPPIPYRQNASIANNVMFHIGGIYEASAMRGHAKWLGGSEGCFAFIPSKSIRATAQEAALVNLENVFVSNKTWVNLTTMIEKFRDSGPSKRFTITIERRPQFPRDQIKTIVFLTSVLHDGANRFNSYYEENASGLL